jgi:hypothetical protein
MNLWLTAALVVALSMSLAAVAQVSVDASTCITENNAFRSELYYGDKRIQHIAIIDKQTGTNLLAPDTVPYFSLVVNRQLITSNMPIWKYRAHALRQLVNGGTEIQLQFAASGAVKGLLITIYRQWFPGSLFLRERLELSTTGPAMQLNKLQGRLHLEFPAYAFTHNTTMATTTWQETRIASFAEELLPVANPAATYDDRQWDGTRTFNLAHCHMFHPKVIKHMLEQGSGQQVKGPLAFWQSGQHHFFFSYEHASQDKAWAEAKPVRLQQGSVLNDEQQGTAGAMDLPFADSTLQFISLQGTWYRNCFSYRQAVQRGAYLEGETFSAAKPYSTVWSALGASADSMQRAALVHQYLWSYITEHPASRRPHFYYNTWGMQRDNTNHVGLREIFTEQRIRSEIANAAQLGVELFVLDDGWEEKMGEWTANSKRLPNGLQPLVQAMHDAGMIPGIWISPMGIDSTAQRYRTLKHLVIKDLQGKPIKAQWDHPAFDFVSAFKDTLVADCKKLIDQGIRFFKWDAINTFNSTVANAYHGTNADGAADIRDRYAYLLPFYVTQAMRELRQYCPDVVVELDVTEKERCVTGLMPLQEGKLFWMNNGASGYNDYGYHRSKSMRTVINRFAGILPTELFTQAVYPHNSYPFFAQRYNVNTTLTGGRGFWGNLALMDSAQRIRVGKTIALSKRILPQVVHLPLEYHGKVGASPEWYLHLNRNLAAGQLTAFSAEACIAPISLKMNRLNNLAVLRHAYRWKDDSLQLDMQFLKPDDSREVFMVNNRGTGIGIEYADGWIEDALLDTSNRTLTIFAGAACRLLIRFPAGINPVLMDTGESMQPQSSNSQFSYRQLVMKAGEKVNLKW